MDFETYAKIKPMKGAIASSWKTAFNSIVLPELRQTAECRVLDYGFGDGRYFEFFSNSFSAEMIYGVEVSHRRAERAQAKGWDQVIVVNANPALPFKSGLFSFINMVEVIEHIDRDLIAATLKEFKRVLQPSGWLLVTTPNYPIKRVYDWVDALKNGFWSRLRDDPTHITHYCHRSLIQALSEDFESRFIGTYKEGFLFRRWPHPWLKHKILLIARPRVTAGRPLEPRI